MTTDTELRDALIAAVDEHVDLATFRARLQTTIDGADAGPVFDLQRSEPNNQRRRGRHRWVPIALAACLAAIAAVAWVVTARHPDTRPATHPTHRSRGPQVLGVPLYPGSVVIGVVHGIGSRTVAFPTGHAVPGPHEQYMVFLDCSTGPWQISGKNAFNSYGKCADAIGGSSVERTQNSVHVQVRRDTTWRLGIAIEPDARTNAGVQTGDPVDKHPGPTHKGNGVVTFRHADGGSFSLHMTCSGTGFRLSGMHGTVKGDYTHTCFAGFTYVWNLRYHVLPATLHVHADPGTTWTAEMR